MTLSWLGAGTLARWTLPLLPTGVHAITASPRSHGALRDLGAVPSTEWTGFRSTVVVSLPGSARQLEAVERLMTHPVQRAVFVSTVGLHAPYQGVVHASSPAGATERAALAAEAEHRFRDWAGDAGVILRLGGLHAPGRGPAAVFERRGSARAAPAGSRLPLIHYADAAQLVVAALEGRTPSVVLGVTEAPRRDVFYGRVAERLGVAPPELPDGESTVTFDTGPACSLLTAPCVGPESW